MADPKGNVITVGVAEGGPASDFPEPAGPSGDGPSETYNIGFGDGPMIDVETVNTLLAIITKHEMMYPLGSSEAVAIYLIKQDIEKLGGGT